MYADGIPNRFSRVLESSSTRYEREGRFSSLPTLFDKQSSTSLTFGSMVDALLTGDEEEFADQFMILDNPNISDTLKDITQTLVDRYPEETTSFDNIPDNVLAEVGKEHDFWANDKYIANRIKLIKQNCKTFYSILKLSRGKTVVSPTEVEDARRCVNALKNSERTKFLFQDNDPFDERFRRYYQLKFKCVDPISKVEYRSMADLILVDYVNKIIYPFDLKTSSHDEWDFPRSFTKWSYHNQSRLYWRNIRQNLDKDEYFKDFELADYRFIVINRKNCKPMIWLFSETKRVGDISIRTKSGYTYNWRDPYTIGSELDYYLKNKCDYPIESDGDNDIVSYLVNN